MFMFEILILFAYFSVLGARGESTLTSISIILYGCRKGNRSLELNKKFAKGQTLTLKG